MSATPEAALRGLIEVMTLMVRADGRVDHEEILQFMESLQDKPPFNSLPQGDLFRLAQQVGNQDLSGDAATHLQRIAPVLDAGQKGLAYQLAFTLRQADGEQHDRETALLQAMQQAFGLSAERVSQLEMTF